jgi:hypothetical protein
MRSQVKVLPKFGRLQSEVDVEGAEVAVAGRDLVESHFVDDSQSSRPVDPVMSWLILPAYLRPVRAWVPMRALRAAKSSMYQLSAPERFLLMG